MLLVQVADDVELVLQPVTLHGSQADLTDARLAALVLLLNPFRLRAHGHDQVRIAADHGVHHLVMQRCHVAPRGEAVRRARSFRGLIDHLQGTTLA